MSKFDKAALILKWLNTLAVCLVVILTILALLLASNEKYSFSNQQPVKITPPVTTLLFAGDIMLSRNVGSKIFQSQDYDLPFKNIGEQIRQASVSFANLESPFSDKGPRITQGVIFKAEPESVKGLVNAGWDIIATTNNHAFDQGKYGVGFTLSLLEQNGIGATGTGPDCHDGVITEKNKIKIGFLAYSYGGFNDGGKRTDPLICDMHNLETLTRDIIKLKEKADFIVVSMHAGTEYTRTPTQKQIDFAHAAIDAGADLVVGSHPHWIQTIEQYHDKWIFYSLGNLVFDQMWSEDTKEGLVVKITLQEKKVKKIELLPVIIEDYCCPRWANLSETKTILGKIDLTNPILIDKND